MMSLDNRNNEVRRLWQRVRRDCEWGAPRAPSARLLFGDVRATPAVLELLKDARVGRMPGRVFLTGGPDVDEGELEGTMLWAPEEEEAGSSGVSEGKEDGPGPPL